MELLSRYALAAVLTSAVSFVSCGSSQDDPEIRAALSVIEGGTLDTFREQVEGDLAELVAALENFGSGEDQETEVEATQDGRTVVTRAPMPASWSIIGASRALRNRLGTPLLVTVGTDEEIDALVRILKKDFVESERLASSTIEAIRSRCQSACRSRLLSVVVADVDDEDRLYFVRGNEGLWADKLFDVDLDAWGAEVKELAENVRSAPVQ